MDDSIIIEALKELLAAAERDVRARGATLQRAVEHKVACERTVTRAQEVVVDARESHRVAVERRDKIEAACRARGIEVS